jgi:hypothetical protein
MLPGSARSDPFARRSDEGRVGPLTGDAGCQERPRARAATTETPSLLAAASTTWSRKLRMVALRNELITSDSNAQVRVTCLPNRRDSNPSLDASRTRGRSSPTGPEVVFTVRGS